MSIERQYIRQFLNESKKPARKFEDSGYKYAYTTKDRAEEGGWVIADSPEELKNDWTEVENYYGRFNPKKILVLKPAVSVDKAMVFIYGEDPEGTCIFPSIDATINDSRSGLLAMGWQEDENISEAELQELLQTKDLKRAEELLKMIFDDGYHGYGLFTGMYEYVSGPMPKEDGVTPGSVLIENNISIKASRKDSEYYRRKILANPENLEKVPDKLKTPELCKLAVEKSSWALEFVPDELKTPELCKLAVEDDYGNALKFVPDKFKTPELCKIAVETKGSALEFVPDELKTPELCKLAVEDWGITLQLVPDKLKTLELCKIAVEKDDEALEFVPDHLKEQVKKELRIK